MFLLNKHTMLHIWYVAQVLDIFNLDSSKWYTEAGVNVFQLHATQVN